MTCLLHNLVVLASVVGVLCLSAPVAFEVGTGGARNGQLSTPSTSLVPVHNDETGRWTCEWGL